jgi:hypothetical protein
LNLRDAVKKLTALIKRLKGEMSSADGVRVYGINTDFVTFSEANLGDLILTDSDAKEYRQCVDAIYAQVAGKAEHISRSAVESFIQSAMLKAIDPIQAAVEKDFPKRLESALAALKEELKAKPSIWEIHFPVDGVLTDNLPLIFGRCHFYFGDPTEVSGLLERINRVIVSAVGDDSAQTVNQDVATRIRSLVSGKTWLATLVEAVDGEAARRAARKRVRQTADILNFYANLGGRAPSQVLLAEDPRPGILNTFLFSEDPPAFQPPSERVGPIAQFSFAAPDLAQAGFERISNMLKSRAPSEFEDRVIRAFQWAGKASVEPRKEEAFLLFTISLESLLLERNDKSEITETLALRAAHLISAPSTRLMVYRDMKRLYGIRSKIVHSGSVDVGEDQLSEIRYYTRFALLTLLCSSRYLTMTKDAELMDWFRARLLNTPQNDKDHVA